jgi:hypothetical protein
LSKINGPSPTDRRPPKPEIFRTFCASRIMFFAWYEGPRKRGTQEFWEPPTVLLGSIPRAAECMKNMKHTKFGNSGWVRRPRSTDPGPLQCESGWKAHSAGRVRVRLAWDLIHPRSEPHSVFTGSIDDPGPGFCRPRVAARRA